MQKCVIRLSVFLTSLLFLFGCSKQDNSSSISEVNVIESEIVSSVEGATENDVTTVTGTEKAENKTSAETKKAEKKSTSGEKSKYNIEISGNDGNFVQEGYNSISDIDMNRPVSLRGSEVFTGWENQDILSQISDNNIEPESDIVLIPETEDISDTENAVFNDTIYASVDEEFIDIPIKIGGKVNFSVLELEINFSGDSFAFESFIYEDEDATCNSPDAGKILINFVSTENIGADVDLCTIRLKNTGKQKGEFSVKYNVRNIAAWNDDSTDYINVGSKVVNNRIVMY